MKIALIIAGFYFYINFLFMMCCLGSWDGKKSYLMILFLGIPLLVSLMLFENSRLSKFWYKL